MLLYQAVWNKNQHEEPTDKGNQLNYHDRGIGPLGVISPFPLGGRDG